jgi:hypothetical protein
MSTSAFTCRSFAQHLSDWRDGQPGAPHEYMQAHILACGRCAALYRALEIGVRVLQGTEILAATRLLGR